MNLPAGFSGSMVASASDNVVAIAQLGNNQVGSLGTPGGLASSQYRGSSAGDSIITFPTVKQHFGNKITVFSVQATGDVGYTATIKDNAGGTHTRTGTIGANRSIFLRPDTGFTPAMAGSNCGTDPNASPCLGSLTVAVTSGTGQLVGAVVETQTNVTPQAVAQATSLFTSTDASNTVFCPVVKNGFSTAQKRHSGVCRHRLRARPAARPDGCCRRRKSQSDLYTGSDYPGGRLAHLPGCQWYDGQYAS
jgi:hypothetical protein